jgi:radical SAM protein with 4Fe4S-binding SPASM domain
MKKESYEAVTRTPGSFEAAFRGINLFLKYKVPFTVRSAVLPPNKTEINAFDKWALTIPRMKKRLPSYSMFLDLHCRGDMHKDKLIKKLRIIPQEGVQILLRRQKGYASSIREFFANFTASPTNRLFTCIVGLAGACVDAYGYLHPCQLMKCPDFAYDLRNGSLQDALTYAFPRLREMRSTNGEYLSRCARCFLKGFCQQCPAKSWNEHGSLDKPVEYFCEVAHTQAEYLGLLQSGEKAWQVNNWQERLNNFLRKDKEG